MKLWLNVAEGAEYASVCRDLIYDACAARRIHHIRVGGRRAIRLKRECVRASVPGRPLAGQPEAWERGDLKPTVRQAQELAKLQAEMMVQRITAMKQVSNVLNVDQRAKLQELREQRKARFQEWRERHRPQPGPDPAPAGRAHGPRGAVPA